MQQFIIKYRTAKNGIAGEIILAQNKSHAFALARARYGNRVVRVEDA